MKPEYDLISFHIIEKFKSNSLITWTYPSITDSLKQYLLGKCLIKNQNRDFTFYKAENQWIYIWERYKEQKTYALALITKTYNPDKYQEFGSYLCNIYESKYAPIDLVKVFLGTFTKGYKIQDAKTASNEENGLKDLFRLFDNEIILIYNALLLKKRVFVYHSNFTILLKHLKTMTHLVDWKLRNPNEYLFPMIRNVAIELKDRNFFVAGLTDQNVSIKPEAYDLSINLHNGAIKISPNCKDASLLRKWHKDPVPLLTLHKTDEPSIVSNKQIIEELQKRTADLLTTLKSLTVASTTTV